MSRQKQAGFTIVELLIVIVVIGILAAITVVAYNGVTEQSKMSSARVDLRNFEQAIIAARISESKVLKDVTGSINSAASQAYMNNSIDDIAAASGINIQGLKSGDPWGNYYRMDENELEIGPTDCRQDRIWSTHDPSLNIYLPLFSQGCL